MKSIGTPNIPILERLLRRFQSQTPVDGGRTKDVLPGDVPSPIDPPTGCVFHTRCAHARPQCVAEQPSLRETASSELTSHKVACHFDL